MQKLSNKNKLLHLYCELVLLHRVEKFKFIFLLVKCSKVINHQYWWFIGTCLLVFIRSPQRRPRCSHYHHDIHQRLYAYHWGKNRPSIKKYGWCNAIIGRFNLDDIAELSYFMAFSLPMNEAQRRRRRLCADAERPSMIFISQPAEHIHCGLDKDRKSVWKGSASPYAPDKIHHNPTLDELLTTVSTCTFK